MTFTNTKLIAIGVGSIFTGYYLNKINKKFNEYDYALDKLKKDKDLYVSLYNLNSKTIDNYSKFIRHKGLDDEFIAMTTREIDKIKN